jgi:shikimate kinase
LSRPAVVLIGIPASGKSTVAALVASSIGLEVVETDAAVELSLNATATETFAEPGGEAEFRRAEEAAALAALEADGVLVLGSGAIESAKVRQALGGHRVIWLRATVATATRRLGMTRLGMEALVAIRTRLDAQLAERAGWYEAVASETIDTDRLGAAEIAALILAEQEA